VTAELTPRQRRQVNLAIGHLGRAMKALQRADLPLPPPSLGTSPFYDLDRGVRLVGEASDALIDGMEQLDGAL